MHTYIHTCIHTYIHAYIHTYIHAYIHTYIHTCIHTSIYPSIHTCTMYSPPVLFSALMQQQPSRYACQSWAILCQRLHQRKTKPADAAKHATEVAWCILAWPVHRKWYHSMVASLVARNQQQSCRGNSRGKVLIPSSLFVAGLATKNTALAITRG